MASCGALNRRQFWRRQISNTRHNKTDSIFYQNQNTIGSNKMGRSWSEQQVCAGGGHLNLQNKPWATTGDLQEPRRDIHGKKLKSVMFSSRVHVVLIPTIAEYVAAGLSGVLWWDEENYKDFKSSALFEVRQFMAERHITDSKDAIRQLYMIMDKDITENEIQSSQPGAISTTAALPIESISLDVHTVDEEKNQEISQMVFIKLSKGMKAHSFSSPEKTSKRDSKDISCGRAKTDIDVVPPDKRSINANSISSWRNGGIPLQKHPSERSITLHPLGLIACI